jgi:hypothetical protein
LLHLSIEFRAPNRLALSSHIWPLRPWQYGLAEVRGAIMMEHNWHEWRLCLYVFIVGVSKVDSRIPLAVNWTWPSNASMMELFLVFRAWMVVERTWEYIQCRTLSAVSNAHNDHVTGNTWSSTYGLIWFHLKSRRLCIDLVYTNCAYLTYFASCSMEIYWIYWKNVQYIYISIYLYLYLYYILYILKCSIFYIYFAFLYIEILWSSDFSLLAHLIASKQNFTTSCHPRRPKGSSNRHTPGSPRPGAEHLKRPWWWRGLGKLKIC